MLKEIKDISLTVVDLGFLRGEERHAATFFWKLHEIDEN